ncbi:helix-turn-helix transcriptional regulator [Siminovitchia fordii]|uniref:Transcriptional regulator n=1 Tax=Siminovitchia fordii TaxID=254759 RepID=A0ABQ4KA98_9BACI|nr:helix-turn-helix transcriptional regulator [Siminovitchia fordii]GIN22645.1 transcriptional regulator [Siminovitchia fordii]
MLKPKIRVRLAELNIKQQDLSEKIGVTKQTMSAWVNGKTMPTLETAFKIAKILGCKVDDLFVYEEE